MITQKYIDMLTLSAQINALLELPYNSVYKADASLNDLKVKSAVFMDDVIKSINDKRGQLALLDGTTEILKLKKVLKQYETLVGGLEVALKHNEEFIKTLNELREKKDEK